MHSMHNMHNMHNMHTLIRAYLHNYLHASILIIRLYKYMYFVHTRILEQLHTYILRSLVITMLTYLRTCIHCITLHYIPSHHNTSLHITSHHITYMDTLTRTHTHTRIIWVCLNIENSALDLGHTPFQTKLHQPVLGIDVLTMSS